MFLDDIGGAFPGLGVEKNFPGWPGTSFRRNRLSHKGIDPKRRETPDLQSLEIGHEQR
jgi:hypothetical protein